MYVGRVASEQTEACQAHEPAKVCIATVVLSSAVGAHAIVTATPLVQLHRQQCHMSKRLLLLCNPICIAKSSLMYQSEHDMF